MTNTVKREKIIENSRISKIYVVIIITVCIDRLTEYLSRKHGLSSFLFFIFTFIIFIFILKSCLRSSIINKLIVCATYISVYSSSSMRCRCLGTSCLCRFTKVITLGRSCENLLTLFFSKLLLQLGYELFVSEMQILCE